MVRQYVTFRLGEALFGVDVLLVREVCRDVQVTPVTPAPGYVSGVMNLRGQTVAIADLRVRVGLAATARTSARHCVVLKSRSEVEHLVQQGATSETMPPDTVGLLIDNISDLVAVDDSQIEPPPSHTREFDARFIAGVARLEVDVLAVLHVGEVVSADE